MKRHTLAAMLTASACAAPPPPPQPAAPPAPAPVAIAEAEPADEPPEPPPARDALRTDVRDLAEIACSVESPGGDWNQGLPLRFSPNGPAFARVHGVASVLELSRAIEDGARLAVEADGFAIRGRAAAKDVVLTPARARLVGVVVPKSGARLSWIGSENDAARVALRIRGPLRPVGDRSLEWAAPCAELSLAVQQFDARAATGVGEPKRRAYFDGKGPVELGSDPAGGATLTLNVDGTSQLEVHDSRGMRTLILFDNDNSLLFGWVDDQRLSPTPQPALGQGYGSGRGRLGRRHVPLRVLSCSRDVELSALIGETGQPRGVIGVIRSGTVFSIRHSADDLGFHELGRFPSWLAPEAKARLAVPSDQLADCGDASTG